MAARHCCHATTAAALLEWESSFSLSAGSSPAARGVERRVCSGKSSGPLRARPSRSQKRMRKVRVVAGVVACSRVPRIENRIFATCAAQWRQMCHLSTREAQPRAAQLGPRAQARHGLSLGSPWALLRLACPVREPRKAADTNEKPNTIARPRSLRKVCAPNKIAARSASPSWPTIIIHFLISQPVSSVRAIRAGSGCGLLLTCAADGYGFTLVPL